MYITDLEKRNSQNIVSTNIRKYEQVLWDWMEKLSFIFNQKLIENTHTIYHGKTNKPEKNKTTNNWIELNWINQI